MLPESILLAGIVVLIALETAGARERSALPVALLAMIAAAAGAAWLSQKGYVMEAFPGHFSVDPQSLLAKAFVLALAVPVLLISRDEIAQRQLHILLLSSLYGVCLLLSADSFLTLFLGIELMMSAIRRAWGA